MRHTDVAIVGGGLAGSTAAAMLGCAGIDAVLIEPHTVYPPDFRCEKLDAMQVALLRKTGLADTVLPAATLDDEVWIARFGHLVDQRPTEQYDILYDAMVNTVRAAILPAIDVVHAKATAIATSAERQNITLSNGTEISARLVVLASGLNLSLRQSLGMTREILSRCYSISIGFDLKPVSRPSFPFRSLTYFSATPADRMAYLTLFPIGAVMRANLFVYRDMDDPWLRELRAAPEKTLHAAMPGLRKLTGDFEVTDPIRIRPVDLCVTSGHRQAGVVVVGDAYATSCPAAGTGANKVFTDVERLCHVHIPHWLATEGMGEEKIAAFYDDEVKMSCDAASTAKAYFLRSLSTDDGLTWRARRWARFLGQLGIGIRRQLRQRLSMRPLAPQGPARPATPDASTSFGL